jgi:uncharacterized protein (TIGR02300 family)
LANPELGAKQICPNCSTKFYDLTRRPAHCPKCGTDFDPEEALRNRRVRARAVLPDDDEAEEKVVAKPESEDGFESEPDDAPELDEVIDEPPLITSDDDDDADPDSAPAAPDEELGVDFAEDDAEEAEDDEVPFLEDEDDDFSETEIDGLPEEGGTDDR